MGRRLGGLRMLPPFGLPEYHQGDYTGTIEALNAVSTYIRGLSAKYIVMLYSRHSKREETLAEYYFRMNRHLLGNIVVAEFNPETETMRIVGCNKTGI